MQETNPLNEFSAKEIGATMATAISSLTKTNAGAKVTLYKELDASVQPPGKVQVELTVILEFDAPSSGSAHGAGGIFQVLKPGVPPDELSF